MDILKSDQKWSLPREFISYEDTKEWLTSLGFKIDEQNSNETQYSVQAPAAWKLICSDVEIGMPSEKRLLSFIVNSNGIVVAIIYATKDRHSQDWLQATRSK